MSIVQKHFVDFYSPGTFFSEVTEKPIYAWDVNKAVEIAGTIIERYNARPYGFRFLTRSRGPDDLDSKVTDKSPMYYLGGRIETLEEVEARNNPSESVLRANMRGNGYNRIITNTNSWRFTGPLMDDDIVLDVTLP